MTTENDRDRAFNEGAQAYRKGVSSDDNPYGESDLGEEWAAGWDDAESQGPTNPDRVEAATAALEAHAASKGEVVDEDNVGDLLADLMHYCAENGIDFATKLTVAEVHFNCETE